MRIGDGKIVWRRSTTASRRLTSCAIEGLRLSQDKLQAAQAPVPQPITLPFLVFVCRVQTDGALAASLIRKLVNPKLNHRTLVPSLIDMLPSSKLLLLAPALLVLLALTFISSIPFTNYRISLHPGSSIKHESYRAPRKNIWADLDEKEATKLIRFLHTRPNDLNLTKSEDATR